MKRLRLAIICILTVLLFAAVLPAHAETAEAEDLTKRMTFDFTGYSKTCFYKRLEAITDSNYKTVALFKKVHNFFAYIAGLKYVCNELS